MGFLFCSVILFGAVKQEEELSMSKKTMTIAFPRGGIIPAAVLSIKEDKVCSPHEPVKVPTDYGQHLIDDRFAVAVTSRTSDSEEKAEMDAAAKKKAEADAAAKKKAEDIAAAEKKVESAKAALTAAGTDTVALDAAQVDLKAAEAELLLLKA
ncbi:hypothetical protein CFBP4996_18145 [Agrobacterium leguminum]|uniref:Uncharacterized protein n=2 Tax=Agrobacterium TaxID=357 RepID=A0A1S7TY52_9HYPH|nr:MULTISPECIES: hypothetical protein [Agrobacterium]MCZ7909382.1 hypothetical protein [Agrobacterium leguminum]WFS67946.1 hypothetical protein CFBP4996_18145 [Agrobacterium leguminum]CVI59519.1 conserved hypothetical protein [Agrobacterium deltaense NCPPB 1641]